MISIIITSYNEPKTIGKAIKSFLNQNIKEEYEIIVSAPDKKTQEVAKKYKKVKLFKDPGKGKSLALNLLLPKLKGRIIILTDGDVYVSKNSVNEILKIFEDKKVGAVSGRVIPQNKRNNLFGFWSHLLCHAAHKLREDRNKKDAFLECTGYLWAFRNNIRWFPKDVAEDTIIPIFLWQAGWKIKYAEKAKVYVKYPNNLNDFIKQKTRTAKAHKNIGKYANEIPRMKTFFNEVAGSFIVLTYPITLKEFWYTLLLFPARLYIWLIAYFKRENYQDGWERVESTK